MTATSARHRCLAVCPPGIEALTSAELANGGVRIRRSFSGGVEFSATDRQLYRANLWLRTATRIVVRVATFEAHDFRTLDRALAGIDWSPWVGGGTPVDVRVSSTASRLYHTEAIAERVRFAAGTEAHDDAAAGRPLLVVVRFIHDRVTVSVDSSGEPLHRRGWRQATAKAPLRETLAAAMLLAAGWDPTTPLVDPFCGAGTIVVEAACMAAGLAPGRGREFAFERWPSFRRGTWASVTGEAAAARAVSATGAGGGARATTPALVGSDRDPGAVAAARANAERAGVADLVVLRVGPVSSLQPPEPARGGPPGWLVTNPPHGRRVGGGDLRNLMGRLGALARTRLPGWGVGVLLADPRLASATGLALDARFRTRTGGVPVGFWAGRAVGGSPEGDTRVRRYAAPAARGAKGVTAGVADATGVNGGTGGPAAGVAADDDERTRGLVDPDALGRWMDEHGLPGAGEPITTRFLSGGSANEIFEIRRGEECMVLRRPPRIVPDGREETMLREYRVLAALDGTDVPHPRAIAVCPDSSVIGAAFYLMGHVDGWSPMNTNGWPPPFDADLDARAGLAFQLVDGIARLSRVDWKARGLEGFGKPDGFHERQVDRWLAHLAKVKFRDLPGIDDAAQWLRGHRPRSYEPGIMHGDYQYANVMFAHGAPARLAAIVDWEMSTIGDPLLDLAWVVMDAPETPEEAEKASTYVDLRGTPTRSQLLDYYSSHSGRPVDEIDYYVILARFKLAIVLEAGYARLMRGEADNPKMAAYGDVVLRLAEKAGELARTTPLR